MNNEKSGKDERNVLYSLIPLEDFKGLLGVDDRDDKIARFCLVTSTHTIEQYCKRRLLKKTHFERSEFYGDLVLPLREYPVGKIIAGYLIGSGKWGVDGVFLEPEFYSVVPDCGCGENLPFNLYLSPAVNNYPRIIAIKIVYSAGYEPMKNEQLTMNNESKKNCFPVVPADLATACLELASWNFNRYKGRRIGMTGNVRGAGKEGEHFEMSMPENVKNLLEPYKRKVI
jgi:hypothetical protein